MSAVPQTTVSQKPLLPGFGRPLNYVPKDDQPDFVGKLFPNALTPSDLDIGRTKMLPRTVRELVMLRFMNSVTDKLDWHLKVIDNEISTKWKQEAISSGVDMTRKMADYCIDELRHMASIHATVGAGNIRPPVIVFPGHVVKSDTAVSPELHDALQEAVKTFEAAISERLKDWHPGSNEMVWDLVHPSLWPLVYGRSRVLLEGQIASLEDCIDRCGQGEVPPVPSDEDTKDTGALETRYSWNTHATSHAYSKKFQWLPCEVDISGKRSRIVSYINNLHPKETRLYDSIAKLVDASIPLWNVTLTPFSRDFDFDERRIRYRRVVYDPDPASVPESEGPQKEDGESDEHYYSRREEWIEVTQKLVYPEPKKFKPITSPSDYDLKKAFGTRGLQVIVKLANIELTPEKPKYDGGSWHVEGHLNEHIVATSLYYYSSENITTSTLAFRQQINNEDLECEVNYEQNDSDWLSPIFGCEQDGSAVQELGSVDTKEGRLITFPNILQHRVGPFELADPSKRGHRKIVALFLVDPNIKVISTAHVPCQQQEWWWEKVMATDKSHPVTGLKGVRPSVSQVPIELQEGILQDVDFPFDLEQAKELRLELMEERKAFVLKSSEAFMETTISLCEH
ncbi:hypothetical protein CPB83DRAFT_839565 [Crepidotus variabilis]|uniref:Duf1665 domain containing protein n=1 Tax=Crepidotus variabilis TaxID=179855 RepID=A0A9P6E6X1_9AGAR|nr:hypothetical protein CPB83DRAFT_839565 [Crepidotus variabilis]